MKPITVRLMRTLRLEESITGILEELRKENPEIIADYFKNKRQLAKPDVIENYGMNETVALLSKAMKRDLFSWFNSHGIPVSPDKTAIKVE